MSVSLRSSELFRMEPPIMLDEQPCFQNPAQDSPGLKVISNQPPAIGSWQVNESSNIYTMEGRSHSQPTLSECEH